jgi:soluble lytic murein transglycosylase-like protein
MARRKAGRRLSRVAVASAATMALAVALTPEPAPLLPPVPRSAGALAAAPPPIGAPLRADTGTLLSAASPWKPAGTVLRRGTRGGTPAPFAPAAPHSASASLQRWHRIYRFSTRFRVAPELARLVHDIAVQEGIEPELAFRLVQVESRFNPRAASPAGAVGLTQLMPGTAREFQPDITREGLLDPATNLRIGFRYLRALIREQRGNLRLALLVYNRGPLAVAEDLARGVDPANGYERVVMKGYRGRGILD